MESYLTFEFVFSLTLSIIFTAKGTKLTYTVSKWKCPTKIELGYATILKSKVAEDCVEKCALRKHCAFLTYARRVNICKLYSVDIPSFPEDVKSTVPCIIVKRSDIGPYPGAVSCNCQEWDTCDPNSYTCRKTECLPPLNMLGRAMLGNLNHNDSVIRFTCQTGYHESNGGKSITCVDGEWQRPPFTSCDVIETSCAVGNTWRTTELGLQLLVVTNTRVNYDDALTCCHNNEGQLMRVDSLEVKNKLDSEMAGSSAQVWIDGRFDSNVGEFVFSDGTRVSMTFWQPGQPDENACIRRVGEYWYDRDCQIRYGFICQRS